MFIDLEALICTVLRRVDSKIADRTIIDDCRTISDLFMHIIRMLLSQQMAPKVYGHGRNKREWQTERMALIGYTKQKIGEMLPVK